jgi:hypothetical protein
MSWRTVDDPQEMEALLLQRNQHHFGQAQSTPFTVDPLNNDVDFATTSISSSFILQGEYTMSELTELTQ